MTDAVYVFEAYGAVMFIVGIITAIIAVGVIIYDRIKTKHTFDSINSMLDSAINGTFSESRFDETEMSALESKLWNYLESSEISAKKIAEEKDKIKTLISDISHQTKTPVSNILLYCELLSEQPLSDELKEYVGAIGSQSEKLSFLIASLVKMSRLETGIISLNPSKGRVVPMLKEVVSQIQPEAARRRLALKADYGDPAAEAVFDEKWTSEALFNIVHNAVKYTKKGGIKICVKDYEMFVCVEVTDTGMGIPEEEQAQIFSRFYRSEQASGEEGLGIGLYLAREIVTAENGYIKVASEAGKGSVFSVFLSKL